MNLQEIEQNVTNLDPSRGDFIYDLLRAYGIPKASISRLQSGTYDRSSGDNEHLWRGKLYYRFARPDEDLHGLIDDANRDDKIMRERPRFLVVRDDLRLVAIDTKVQVTLDIALSELPGYAAFFLPWAGIEKTQLETLNYADIKAAEKMARLYDEIVKHNEITTSEDIHDLNVFFSRLLFCFFAEDTGVFPKGSFTDAIASLTSASGEDTAVFLDRLFGILDTPPSARDAVPGHFAHFGYVNGNLFARRAAAPVFTSKARRVVLECGTLNWSQINPDIFGSMIQVVVHPGQRQGLGMHYTSVENIMKVIRPLFLDDLQSAFEASIDRATKLKALLDRISRIRVFDPACGSGNFLVIAYKELRKLEHQILQRLADLERLDSSKASMFKLSVIKLENFFGIEIDDFAHEIAILSLWLAKHQMNVEFRDLFGVEISLIPLRDTGNIACANAAQIDWTEICPPSDSSETFLCSNPPYQYGTKRTPEQSQDVVAALEDPKTNKYLDYVSIWLFKGARYVAGTGARLGFVATNSICQGKQVGLLWPKVLELGVEIQFARTSFRWSNSAKANAGVMCVIVGLGTPLGTGSKDKRLFDGDLEQHVPHINPYLVATNRDTVVYETDKPLTERPRMAFGSMPRDGGYLILSRAERDAMIERAPDSERFIRPYIGGAEFIKGTERFCLWIKDDEATVAESISEVAERLARVKTFRSNSNADSTRAFASSPHRFVQISHRDTQAIAVPAVSSERRDYIPMGFLAAGTVVSNKVYVIYDAEPWLFGLLQSRMHMVWMRGVGGRMKNDYSYANSLIYNTFPFPDLRPNAKDMLLAGTLKVLEAREQFAEKTLSELYDPAQMPDFLRRAHRELDELVDRLYRRRGFDSDEERLTVLFDMYTSLVQTHERAVPVA